MRRSFECLALFAILALASYLRLVNLADNPGWYTDEGTHLDIAHNLLHGRVQYLAITQSVQLFQKMPLFELLLALALRIGGDDIGTLRTLTGALGVISVGLLYLLVRLMSADRILALLAALMLAIYPQAVLYSRFGFSYNLLTPLVLLAWGGLWHYLRSTPTATAANLQASGASSLRAFASLRQPRIGLLLASSCIGIGLTSDLMIGAVGVTIMLIVLTHRWRDGLWGAPLMALPLGVYAIIMTLFAPQAFWFDVAFTNSQIGSASPGTQLLTLFNNYGILFTQDVWLLAALIGLWFLPAPLRWLSLLLFLLPITVMGRVVALHNLSFYYLIPLLPFVALGVASLLRFGALHAANQLRHALDTWQQKLPRASHPRLITLSTWSIVLLLTSTPFMYTTALALERARGNYQTPIDAFLINGADARRVAQFVNAQARPSDVIIASPSLAWLLRANVADFQMTIAYTRRHTPHLPANVPQARFAFDPSLRSARFVVVDNLWRNWAVFNVPGVSEMLAELETWSLVFRAGDITVYSR